MLYFGLKPFETVFRTKKPLKTVSNTLNGVGALDKRPLHCCNKKVDKLSFLIGYWALRSMKMGVNKKRLILVAYATNILYIRMCDRFFKDKDLNNILH